MPLGVRVLAKPMKYCSLARQTLSRSLCINRVAGFTEVFRNPGFVSFFVNDVSAVFVKSVS